MRHHTYQSVLGFAQARAGVMLCAVAILCVSRTALADEPVREIRHDPSAYPPPSAQLPLVAVGAGTAAVWYGLALGGSYLYPTARGADELKIPLAGPWMSLAKTGCPETTPDCSTFWMVVGAIMKAFDGIGQAGGILMLAEGLFLPTIAAPASAGYLAPTGAQRQSRHSVVLLPTALPGGVGVGVSGLF